MVFNPFSAETVYRRLEMSDPVTSKVDLYTERVKYLAVDP